MTPDKPPTLPDDAIGTARDQTADPDSTATADTTTPIDRDGEAGLSRRSFISGAAASVGAAAGAGAAGTGATSSARAQEGSPTPIDMTDQLVFDPDETAVTPRTTVVWENVGNIGHSVTAYEGEIPEEASYFASGGFEAEDAARSAYSAGDPERGDVVGGESFEHTFEVEGTYEYFCIPHESVGMLGTIEVSADAGATEGASGPVIPQVPDLAKTIGIAVSATLIATVGFTYVFLKYGGDYGGKETP